MAQDKVFQVQVERLNPRSILNPHRCIAQGEINFAHFPSLLRAASDGGGEQQLAVDLRPSGRMMLQINVRVDRCLALRANSIAAYALIDLQLLPARQSVSERVQKL